MCALPMVPPGSGDGGKKDPRITLMQMAQMIRILNDSVTTLQGHEERLSVNEAADAAQDVAIADLTADVNILKTQVNSAIKVRSSEKRAIQKAVAKAVYTLCSDKAGRPQHFANVHCGLRDYFHVPAYEDIPLSRFTEAVKLIGMYDGTGKCWWAEGCAPS